MKVPTPQLSMPSLLIRRSAHAVYIYFEHMGFRRGSIYASSPQIRAWLFRWYATTLSNFIAAFACITDSNLSHMGFINRGMMTTDDAIIITMTRYLPGHAHHALLAPPRFIELADTGSISRLTECRCYTYDRAFDFAVTLLHCRIISFCFSDIFRESILCIYALFTAIIFSRHIFTSGEGVICDMSPHLSQSYYWYFDITIQ